MDPISVIQGPVSHLDRADVDTDQIMPKQFLKRVERTGFGEFLFYDWAQEPGWDLPRNPILLAGRNFGCGSSREHAPWALLDAGISCVVAPGFADIFYNNCFQNGLLPVALPQDDVRSLMGEAKGGNHVFAVDLEAQTVTAPSGRAFPFEIDPERKRRMLAGLDSIGETLRAAAAIDAFEARRDTLAPSRETV